MAKKNKITVRTTASEILHMLRKKAKLTQAAMAGRLGIAAWLYQKYENGMLHIPLEPLKQLRGAEDLDAALLNSLELKAYGDSLKEKLQNMTEKEKQEVYGSLLDRMIQCSIEHKTNTTKNQS